MSWSVSAVGKSDAVAKKLASDFTLLSPCREPEESIKQAAAALLVVALAGQIPATAVKVTASGSMSVSSSKDAPDKVTNQLRIEIEPMWNFME